MVGEKTLTEIIILYYSSVRIRSQQFDLFLCLLKMLIVFYLEMY